MTTPAELSFEAWVAEFNRCAIERDVAWLASGSPETRRVAYESGVSPQDELEALADMAQWRGCGCGGG
jgi:hypothetical protein